MGLGPSLKLRSGGDEALWNNILGDDVGPHDLTLSDLERLLDLEPVSDQGADAGAAAGSDAPEKP